MLAISNERLAKLSPEIHAGNTAPLAFWISQRIEMCFFVSIEKSAAVMALLDLESMISDSKAHEKEFGNLLLCVCHRNNY